MKFQTVVYTCDRKENYLLKTLRKLKRSGESKIWISQGSPTTGNLDVIPENFSVELVIKEMDFTNSENKSVRVKAQDNFMNALTIDCGDCDYKLILEDDVIASVNFRNSLILCIDEVRKYEESRPFILTLYSPYTKNCKKLGVRKVKIDDFYGLQSCLFSQEICQDFAEYIKNFNYKLPHDFIIKDFCKERGINIWCSTLSLFQHAGVITTGLGHHHQVMNFIDDIIKD